MPVSTASAINTPQQMASVRTNQSGVVSGRSRKHWSKIAPPRPATSQRRGRKNNKNGKAKSKNDPSRASRSNERAITNPLIQKNRSTPPQKLVTTNNFSQAPFQVKR